MLAHFIARRTSKEMHYATRLTACTACRVCIARVYVRARAYASLASVRVEQIMWYRWLMSAVCVWLVVSRCASEPVYMNSWAVEVRGGASAANEVALKHGFTNLGQVKLLWLAS